MELGLVAVLQFVHGCVAARADQQVVVRACCGPRSAPPAASSLSRRSRGVSRLHSRRTSGGSTCGMGTRLEKSVLEFRRDGHVRKMELISVALDGPKPAIQALHEGAEIRQ